MTTKRIKNTIQRDLTPEQEEEKQAANKSFYNGDITQVFFPDQKDIEQFIFQICRKRGFTPCAKNRKSGDFVQYYCEFSGWPDPSAKFSKKIGCPFFINISRTKNGFHVSSMDARHNHQTINTDYIIDKNIEDEIHIYHAAGLLPRHISKVLEVKGNSIPSIIINSISNKHKNTDIFEEYEELLLYMNQIDGVCVPFDYINSELQRQPIRCAIWTQSPSEHMNLLNFSDLIMFDSTESNLKNGWLTIPISVVDSNRHILPAGLCFAAFETEEVLEFMCKSIFSDDNIRYSNKVIISDEDQAYKAVISRLRHKPKHILCALHKAKNFKKYLKNCDLTKEEKNEAKQLFATICFSTNKQTVEKSFNSLFLYKDSPFVLYCRKLYAEKENFSKAYINAFTMGYNTSSVAESMNRMIKIDSKCKKITLAEFRKQFDLAHKRSAQNNEFVNQRKQYPVNFPFTELVQCVSKTCIIEMYKCIQKSLKFVFRCIDSSPKFHVMHKKKLEEIHEVIILEDTIQCSCNQSILYGYPCVHMITVLLNVRPEIKCKNLIHQHWMINQINELNFGINEQEFDNLPKTVGNSYNDNVSNELELDINMNAQKRYCKILFLGKQLARIGSLATEDAYDRIIENLTGLISVNSQPINSVNEPIMAQPRKKGRKKITESQSQSLDLCKICRGAHKSQDCTIFNYYVWRVKNPSGDKNLRKCSLCNSRGHNYATCDVKIGGTMKVTDRMIFDYYGKSQPPDIKDLINSLRVTEMI